MFEWTQMKGNAQRGTKLRPVLAALPVSAMAFQLSSQQQGGTSRAWHLLRRPRAFAVCSPRLTLKNLNILLFLTFYSTLTAVQWREATCFCSQRERLWHHHSHRCKRPVVTLQVSSYISSHSLQSIQRTSRWTDSERLAHPRLRRRRAALRRQTPTRKLFKSASVTV